MIATKEFFDVDARDLGHKLLGKTIVRTTKDGHVLRAKITEVECYIGEIDKACHAYGFRKTERTAPLFHEGGIAYIYFIYGMYYCMNMVCGKEGYPAGVLIRGVEPLNEYDYIANRRFKKNYDELTKVQKKNLTNGPGKLCLALDITKDDLYTKLYEKGDLYLEDNKITLPEDEIVRTTRIGIDYAEEAVEFPWRFYIKDNLYVSKK